MDEMDERTTPDEDTRATERAEADRQGSADRMPTPEEEAIADDLEVDSEVAKPRRRWRSAARTSKARGACPEGPVGQRRLP